MDLISTALAPLEQVAQHVLGNVPAHLLAPAIAVLAILGFFFKSKSDTDDHTELLIFITPRPDNWHAYRAASSTRRSAGARSARASDTAPAPEDTCSE